MPVGAGSFNVLFAGNIGEAQDFPAVLAAAEMLRSEPHVRWLIVGDGRMRAGCARKSIGAACRTAC